MFFVFHQNNSYGKFKGPALNIIVEAGTPAEANSKALSVDGYYLDEDYQIDCSCCGTRWSEIYEGFDQPDGYTVFATLDEAIEKCGRSYGQGRQPAYWIAS